jgi:hypothetical protein
MTEEVRYTLTEARQVFAKQECMRSGHDYDHIMQGDGELQKLVCSRCGRSWTVTPDD